MELNEYQRVILKLAIAHANVLLNPSAPTTDLEFTGFTDYEQKLIEAVVDAEDFAKENGVV